MTDLFKSASKIVFLTLTFAATVGLFTGHITPDNFMVLAGMAFTYYFQKQKNGHGPD